MLSLGPELRLIATTLHLIGFVGDILGVAWNREFRYPWVVTPCLVPAEVKVILPSLRLP